LRELLYYPRTIVAGWSAMEFASSGVVSVEFAVRVFASVVLLPLRNYILEGPETNVCSLMNTFAFLFVSVDAVLGLQYVSEMFKRVQQARSNEFKLRLRKYL
jgi:hypothetical protein